MPPDSTRIYSATYSNVPVYEYNVAGNHVMRRRSDDWINATHILKVADFDKPARTRILEREVQKGVHEKVQGGYGKYQGTWVPLHDGRVLAERNGVLDRLRPIFDFVPGDRSPPPAPKHATAASSKPRANRQSVPQRKAPAGRTMRPPPHLTAHQSTAQVNSTDDYTSRLLHAAESETPDNETIISESFDDDDFLPTQSGSRKRKRVLKQEDLLSHVDQQHQLWADELLDFFVLNAENPSLQSPPTPPAAINLDRPIDDKGHTALHWAAAMGDLQVVKDLIQRGAHIDAVANNGDTPLMRAVMFTNNFDKQTMPKLASYLIPTANYTEWFGSTVFHQIVATTSSKSKYVCARYYLDSILTKMSEHYSPGDIEAVLDKQDRNGDTAITIAARNGARKCVRSLLGRNAAVDIANDVGETADELIVRLNQRRRDWRHRQLSSSPFQIDTGVGGPVQQLQLNGDTNRLGLFGAQGNGAGDQWSTRATQYPSDSRATDSWKSESALALSSQIMPLLVSKSEKLANALDEELAEKDIELAEAERVTNLRRDEIETLQKQRQDLDIKLRQSGDDYDEHLEQELEALVKECEGLIEEEQTATLARLIAEEEAGDGGPLPDAVDGNSVNVDCANLDDSTTTPQDQLTTQLHEAQQQRQSLVRQIVQDLSAAGVSDRQAEYKRLITGALNVEEKDVENMLPEIVAELEEWKDNAATVGS
ncbi:Transcription factor mbp1 [Elasticomyces elasticus]|nr:Transcription factor mbp1 [Elasticomyces elasticus]